MAAHSRNLGGFSYAVNIDSAALIAQAEAAAKAATPLVGEYIKQESNAIAPLRDGTLIGGSRVESKGDSAIVVYGGVPHTSMRAKISIIPTAGRQSTSNPSCKAPPLRRRCGISLQPSYRTY